MLVLSRRSRESVVVGADNGLHPMLKVTVLDISGKSEVGLEADARRSRSSRGEVWERINAGGQAGNPLEWRAT